jgi:uncharacterized membrane protein YhaH (DUF805 family)
MVSQTQYGVQGAGGMTFGEAIRSCYSNYANFSGRASRSEYWFFTLYHFLIVSFCMVGFPFGLGYSLLLLSLIANFLPSISVLVRRLHDTGRSGWWYWIALVPLVGPILLLIWLCTRGTFGGNEYGPDPLAGSSPSSVEANRAFS